MVKTRPFSYEWANHPATNLALAVKPLKTIVALMVEKVTTWTTKILNQTNQTTFRLAGNLDASAFYV
ncbi:MAG: hypothetical protein ACYDHZ_00865 [Dehalococcoidia bacterium]